MENTQILKGILEGCILSIISKEETYGYELLIKLKDYGFEDMVEGTIYPLLLRLEKKDLITSKKRKEENGMTRKYFNLTGTGKEELDDFKRSWDKLNLNVNKILKECEN
ncbi:PadR family transcriptional regulator [[Clostridium] fimetarium]|uniref:PadR family transcriptional regulator, regulatory protein PadR n=1 Tax=[Clostridium] fimetarium TaxID=99656 RepID=A0A1I0NSA9_9FIRM|nr:PadR family transcriptional regulator [[Clostridium] fimetarium]SEW04529.1 PadR family transcriptional regulator, regulatory protein PadR [[Clostridium] fimetarium]